MSDDMIHADRELARLLEAGEAAGCEASVAAAAGLMPAAACRLSGGGAAVFFGAGSPLNKAIGLGLAGPPAADELTAFDDFARACGEWVQVELSPFTDPAWLAALAARGYRPAQFENELVRPLEAADGAASAADAAVTVEPLAAADGALCADLLCTGFFGPGEHPPAHRAVFQILVRRPDAAFFLARVEGRPAGAGGIGLRGGVAKLFGAATLPEFRKRGVQRALIGARFAWAHGRGATRVAVTTEPGSPSQRNMERLGFRVAYTRLLLTRTA
jgi:GNAT superfamily N-acetyltransferase